jgi:hypothetical protein
MKEMFANTILSRNSGPQKSYLAMIQPKVVESCNARRPGRNSQSSLRFTELVKHGNKENNSKRLFLKQTRLLEISEVRMLTIPIPKAELSFSSGGSD